MISRDITEVWYTEIMKILLLLLLLSQVSFAIVPEQTPECKALYEKTNVLWTELESLLKVKIASRYGWDLIHNYLDSASKTLAKCEASQGLNFRYICELKIGMQRADKQREMFRVQTYEAMVAKARREGRCTNIYRSYGN